jgi:ABC-type Mn2+/Zn2+ transport system ATPase subunit
MKIKKIEWKNVASYGNKIQVIEFPEKSGLIQVIGENGSGKCLHPKTKIIIKIPDSKEFENKIQKYIQNI